MEGAYIKKWHFGLPMVDAEVCCGGTHQTWERNLGVELKTNQKASLKDHQTPKNSESGRGGFLFPKVNFRKFNQWFGFRLGGLFNHLLEVVFGAALTDCVILQSGPDPREVLYTKSLGSLVIGDYSLWTFANWLYKPLIFTW